MQQGLAAGASIFEDSQVTRLDVAPAEAAEEWRRMGEAEMRQVFDRSEPA